MEKPELPEEFLEALREYVGKQATYIAKPRRSKRAPLPPLPPSRMMQVLITKLW